MITYFLGKFLECNVKQHSVSSSSSLSLCSLHPYYRCSFIDYVFEFDLCDCNITNTACFFLNHCSNESISDVITSQSLACCVVEQGSDWIHTSYLILVYLQFT